MVRFNMFDAFEDVTTNGNSIRGLPATHRYNNTNRFWPEATTFSNAHYSADSRVTSLVAEQNSTVGANIANNFRIGNTWAIPSERGYSGGDFPMIEVMEPEGATPNVYYMSLGNELVTVGNLHQNNNFSVSHTLTYSAGQHTTTGGADFEHMTVYHAFDPVRHSW